jgi:hypothetical protein
MVRRCDHLSTSSTSPGIRGVGASAPNQSTTIAAFEDHGVLARTVDVGVPQAAELMRRLAAVGIDMTAVARTPMA